MRGSFEHTLHKSLLCAALIATIAAGTASGQEKYLGPCAVAVSRDAQVLYVANADGRKVAWVELPGGRVVRQVDVPGEATGLALSADGARLFVTCAGPKSTVAVFDAAAGKLAASIPVGHTAMSPVVAPDGTRLYVCNRFSDDVSVIDVGRGAEVSRVKAVREPVAAAVAPDGKMLYVANHLPADPLTGYPVSAIVTLINTQTLATEPVRLAHGAHSLRGLCISPDGKYVFVAHVLANFELIPSQVEMGWMSINTVSILDTQKKKVVNTMGLDELYEAAGNPWGVALTADGKSMCVSHTGTHEVTIVDTATALGTLVPMYISGIAGAIPEDPRLGQDVSRRVKLPGKGPRGLAIVGSTAYVAEYFSDAVAVVDLQARRVATEIAVGPKPDLVAWRRGELLFNDATICRQQWQSCASCHPDGRADALNWDLMNDGVGNTKNTKSMLLADKTPPVMAEAVRRDAAEAVRAGMENILFANQSEETAAAIDQYLRTLKPVPSPHLVEGQLSPAALRGKPLFESAGCAACHPAPLYTDQRMHNVGSKGPYEYTEKFDTPTLVEVWRTAPYLHDGRYATLKELFVKGKHGNGPGRLDKLSAQQLDDLLEFVLSL